MSVTKNLCNGRLRNPLLEVHIGNGRCEGQPQERPGALIGNGCQTTTVTDVGGCNGSLGPVTNAVWPIWGFHVVYVSEFY
jgi:hypothetical protein